MARVWLHIGLMKTGTTALQNWFAGHEAELLQQGILYVRVRPNLPACGPLVDALARAGTDEGGKMLDRIRERVEATLPEDVLISAESFSAHSPLVARKVAAAFSGHDLRILVWLRRQDRYAEAVYKQRIKWNGETGDPHTMLQRIGSALDYEAFLDRWQGALPQARVLPQVYEEWDGKPDSIAAMLTAMGRASLIPPDSVDFRQNVTPCAELISRYNSVPQARARQLRRANRKLMQEFGEAASGRGDVLTPELARQIRDRHAASNQRVRDRWFPDRETLFGDDAAPSVATGDVARMLGRFDELFLGEGKRR